MQMPQPDLTDLSGDSRRREPAISAPALWWLSDTAGAIVFAACLAVLFGGWAARDAMPASAGWLLAGIILSGAMRAVSQGLATVSGQREASRAKGTMREQLFGALLPTRLMRGRLVGEDLRVAVDDVEACEGLVARFRPLRLAAVLSPVLIAVVVAFASWVSALIMLFTLVPFGVGMAFAGLAGKAEADRQLLALSRLSGLFVDRVATLPVILAFGAEDRVTRQIGDAAREVAARTMQVLRVAFISSAVLEFFAALSVALVAVYCGFSLLGLLPFPAPEDLTLARAFFALALAPEFYLGMRRMAAAYHDKQQGEAASAGIAQSLADAAPLQVSQSLSVPKIVSRLAIERLEVTYPDGNRIGPISAEWRGPGLHGVTGATGAGKSTLLHALVGLAPAILGQVLVDGEEHSPGALVPMIGWAGQRPLLLPGTLRGNLTLGSDSADSDEVLRLAAACGLSGLVERRGLDLSVDPRGSGLSGGERRRIGLVRAIAGNRPILLLDEPTADLDPVTAGQVIDLIGQVARTRLVIAATHDAALAARCASTVTLT
jgi:ATP-binding cassette subfamily C protein CydD